MKERGAETLRVAGGYGRSARITRCESLIRLLRNESEPALDP